MRATSLGIALVSLLVAAGVALRLGNQQQRPAAQITRDRQPDGTVVFAATLPFLTQQVASSCECLAIDAIATEGVTTVVRGKVDCAKLDSSVLPGLLANEPSSDHPTFIAIPCGEQP